jgi:hypothetical protein
VRASSPYRDVLGQAYLRLHPHVRIAHEAPLAAMGTIDVRHGRHALTPFFVRAMHLPAEGRGQPVLLTVTLDEAAAPTSTLMRWSRRIGTTLLATRQFSCNRRLVETRGAASVEFDLRVDDEGSLLYEHAASRFLRLPLPRALAPRVRARVAGAPEGWHVEVTVEWRAHLVCTYAGSMQPLPGSEDPGPRSESQPVGSPR